MKRHCEACGAELLWVMTSELSAYQSKYVPCDYEGVKAWACDKKQVIVTTADGKTVRANLRNTLVKCLRRGYIPHQYTCPERKEK